MNVETSKLIELELIDILNKVIDLYNQVPRPPLGFSCNDGQPPGLHIQINQHLNQIRYLLRNHT